MLILSLVMIGLTGVFISSAKTVGQAKQRQQATALATQTLEQLRALPYDLIVSGINQTTTEFASDIRIIDKESTPRLAPAGSSINEELVLNSTGTTAPLSPHMQVMTIENTTYTIATYITQADTEQPAYNLTVIVTYGVNSTDAQNSVIERSTSYSPTGCLSTSTHPFSGPCQPSFSAQAGITAGSISLVPAGGEEGADTQLLEDFGVDSASLDLPMLSSSMTVEQTSRVSALAQTTGVRTSVAGTEASKGGLSQVAEGDTDPSSEVGEAETFAIAPTDPGVLSPTAGTAGSITLTPSTADDGSGSASVSGGSSCQAPPSGSLVPGSQPCGSATVATGGSPSSMSLTLAGLPRTLPAFNLAEVSASGSTSRSLVGQFVSSTSFCSGSSPNCAVASVSRTLGEVKVGGLPDTTTGDTGPTGFDQVVRVNGLVDQAVAESGIGAREPSASRTGSLEFWDSDTGTYSTVSLNQTRNVSGSVSRTYASNDDQGVRIDIDYVIAVQPPQESQDTSCTAAGTRCTTEVTSAPTVRADLRYRVFEVDGSESTNVTSFAVLVDLGGILSQTSYGANPDA